MHRQTGAHDFTASPVPEPTTLALLIAGLGGLVATCGLGKPAGSMPDPRSAGGSGLLWFWANFA